MAAEAYGRSLRPDGHSLPMLRRMYDRLVEIYGPQQWWPASTAFEVVVGAYLTQNTSWLAVERSLANLTAHGALSGSGIRGVEEDELRGLIRPSGFMVRKAAALKAFVAWLDREYGGSLDCLAKEAPSLAREKLLALPGVGPETADAILLYALGQPAMVVDEYLRRITARHGLTGSKPRYTEVQALAVEAFQGDEPASLARHYNEFHALTVRIGKSYCGPRPNCTECPLAEFLPKSGPLLQER